MLKFDHMKKFIITLGLVLAALISVHAQTSSKAYVEIQTSAVCGHCKASIEKAVEGIEGVKFAELDLETKIVSVKYDEGKTNADAIRQAIVQAGYTADKVPPIKEAYDKLDPCCKAPEH